MQREPDVYIIESLHPTDEGNGHMEGGFLAKLLSMHGKRPKYTYIRTLKQFKAALADFDESNYRYLHISAHGNKGGMRTTNNTDIDYPELATLMAPYMKGSRLFLSSCEMVHLAAAHADQGDGLPLGGGTARQNQPA